VGAALAHWWELLSGAVPAPEVKNGSCPEKPNHISECCPQAAAQRRSTEAKRGGRLLWIRGAEVHSWPLAMAIVAKYTQALITDGRNTTSSNADPTSAAYYLRNTDIGLLINFLKLAMGPVSIELLQIFSSFNCCHRPASLELSRN
jgi:hypothetical protein